MARATVCEDSEEESPSPVVPKPSAEPVTTQAGSTSTHQRSTDSTDAQLRHAHQALFGSIGQTTPSARPGGTRDQARSGPILDEPDDLPRTKRAKTAHTPTDCASSPTLDRFRSSAVQDAIEREIICPADDPAATEVIGTIEHQGLVQAALVQPVDLPRSASNQETNVQSSSIPVTWPSVDARTPSTGKSHKSVATTTKSPAAHLAEIQASDSYYQPRPSSRRARKLPEPVADWSKRPESNAKKTQSRARKSKSTAASSANDAESSQPVTATTYAHAAESTALVSTVPESDCISSMVLTNSPTRYKLHVCLPRSSSKPNNEPYSTAILGSPETRESSVPAEGETPILKTKGPKKTATTKAQKASKASALKTKKANAGVKLPEDEVNDEIEEAETATPVQVPVLPSDTSLAPAATELIRPIEKGEPISEPKEEEKTRSETGDDDHRSSAQYAATHVSAQCSPIRPQAKVAITMSSSIKSRPIYRVGLSKRGSVPSLLKMVKK